MLYIVSGMPRSGTTMAMAMLQSGGLEVIMDADRNALAERLKRGESWEMNPRDNLLEIKFARLVHPAVFQDGKAIKIPVVFLNKIPTIPYQMRVLYMWRDAEEVRQSNGALDPGEFVKMSVSEIQNLQRWGRDEWRRLGAEVIEVDYDAILEYPQAYCDLLVRNGWPIDAEKAAAVISPNLKRFVRAELTEGA